MRAAFEETAADCWEPPGGFNESAIHCCPVGREEIKHYKECYSRRLFISAVSFRTNEIFYPSKPGTKVPRYSQKSLRDFVWVVIFPKLKRKFAIWRRH